MKASEILRALASADDQTLRNFMQCSIAGTDEAISGDAVYGLNDLRHAFEIGADMALGMEIEQ